MPKIICQKILYVFQCKNKWFSRNSIFPSSVFFFQIIHSYHLNQNMGLEIQLDCDFVYSTYNDFQFSVESELRRWINFQSFLILFFSPLTVDGFNPLPFLFRSNMTYHINSNFITPIFRRFKTHSDYYYNVTVCYRSYRYTYEIKFSKEKCCCNLHRHKTYSMAHIKL